MQKKIIVFGLLIWLCICIAGAFRCGHPLAGAVLVLAPVAWLFPNVTGVLAYVVEPVYAAILCALAVFAWRRRSTSVAVVFSCLVLGSVISGWIEFERMQGEVHDTVASVFHVFFP